jgi:NDP-sugar pyrophosphorylase family protein|tara:strand:- start:183 stop:932 length:750 start_codon:yes stop_codon:yes gene_type:complete
MVLMLTMAGEYSRFKEFSYAIPKYLLPLSNRTILHHILSSFRDTNMFNEVILVANKKDMRFHSQISRTLEEFNFPRKHITFIDDTLGQSVTAVEGLKFLKGETSFEQPLTVHNIDTILLNRNFKSISNRLTHSDCIIDVFSANNEAYSYVLTDGDTVSTIVEKQLVSDMASSGCYFFKDLNLAFDYLSDSDNYYISNSIMKMIKDGLKVKITSTSTGNDTFVLGTPQEYINSMGFFDLKIHDSQHKNTT